MKTATKLSVAFFLILFLTETTAYSQPVEEEACHSFFVFYCTTCHNTQPICTSLSTQDEEVWKKMIHTMAGYGDLSKADEEYALSCMRFMEPDSKIVCKQK